jgi:hypothetical protein
MFIVKRTSPSGGTEYLVEAVHSRYRLAKLSKTSARQFSTQRAASRLANEYGCEVEEV